MNWVNSILILLVAFVGVFLEAAFDGVRNVLGAQIDILPPLMVYAALSADLFTMSLLAVLGGIWFDTLSINPLGVSILPLFMVGIVIYIRRELILQGQLLAQFVLGLIVGGMVPLMTLMLLSVTRHSPVLNWVFIWQWIVLTASSGALAPAFFKLFGMLDYALIYKPNIESHRRMDREIKRGETDMLVVDELKKDDPQLRFFAMIVFAGMCVLFAGLWWVQLVSSRQYASNLETQSIRTVRLPAERGGILDREGRPLAQNQPNYNVDLYLDELSKNFQTAYAAAVSQTRSNLNLQIAVKEKQLGRKLTTIEHRPYAMTDSLKIQIAWQTRYIVVSNLVSQLSARMGEPLVLTEKDFDNHYRKSLALPLPIMGAGMNSTQLARYEENSGTAPGMDLEVQSLRYYPNGTTAAHLLGYLSHDDKSSDGEWASYNYRLPDFEGKTGIEGLYDSELRGEGGEKDVLVNYLGYRQSENIKTSPEPGQNIVLTIDLDIQKAADAALLKAQANVKGAVVVMDAQNGDVLAMASAPTYDPNHFVFRPDPATREKEQELWTNESLGLQHNRAIYENYHPGSIFKVVVGMAALELDAFDPKTNFESLGYFMVGRRKIGDTAKAGLFDFDRAMAKSSNPYFCDLGSRPGVLHKIINLGERLHLGERTGIMPHQEAPGNFPTQKRLSVGWGPGDTANISIGQGEIDVTPIQMALMAAAVANGGKVFWPRLVSGIQNPDGTLAQSFPEGRVRDHLGVSERTLRLIHEGMLADTEDPEGTGHLAKVPGWRIAGKTGTAQVERNGNSHDRAAQDTWFLSFAPEENPKYVVVVTVEGGGSGGGTCAPVAHQVYLALQKREAKLNPGSVPVPETPQKK